VIFPGKRVRGPYKQATNFRDHGFAACASILTRFAGTAGRTCSLRRGRRAAGRCSPRIPGLSFRRDERPPHHFPGEGLEADPQYRVPADCIPCSPGGSTGVGKPDLQVALDNLPLWRGQNAKPVWQAGLEGQDPIFAARLGPGEGSPGYGRVEALRLPALRFPTFWGAELRLDPGFSTMRAVVPSLSRTCSCRWMIGRSSLLPCLAEGLASFLQNTACRRIRPPSEAYREGAAR